MTHRVLLIDESADPSDLVREDLSSFTDLLALGWFSPDGLAGLRNRHGQLRCHDLHEVVGGLERWERSAIGWMERVCKGGPSFHGQPWRRFLAEPLFREAMTVQAALDAFRLCRSLAEEVPEIRASGRLGLYLHELFGQVPPAGPVEPGRGQRLVRRLRRMLVTGDFLGQMRILGDQLDPEYRWRYQLHGQLPSPRLEPGGVTLFSSYLNNSRILRAVEPLVEGDSHWVVSNPPARDGAAGHRGRLHELWRFAEPEEPAMPGDPLRVVLEAEAGEPERRLLEAWLRTSPICHYWLSAGQAAMARLTRCWSNYLDRARPRLLVVANQWGIEGWFLAEARRRGIPVAQMVHGVLSGRFYTGLPVLSDALVVSGDFWRDLWPPSERKRIHVHNLHELAEQPRAQDSGVGALRPEGSIHSVPQEGGGGSCRRLTHFSWPFDRLDFYPGQDLMAGFVDLFQELLEEGGCSLRVRAHPLENLSDLTSFWQQRHGKLPKGLELSQSEPLHEVLDTTEIAVMFRSTVMLDCFARGIPLLMPSWIDFSWKPQLRGITGVHLAEDFRDLGDTLRRWIADPPVPDRRQAERFLCSDSSESRRDLAGLLRDLQPVP